MADNESKLEKTVKEEGKNLEKKKEKGLFRKAFDLAWYGGCAAGATALSTAALGGPVGAIVGGALGIGTFLGNLVKKSSLYDTIKNTLRNYTCVNAVIYPMITLGNLTYPVIGGLGAKVAGGIGSFIAKSIYSLTGYNAAFNALFKGAEHLQDNYLNPGGIRKSIANNYRNVYSRVQKIFAPAYLLTANGINTIAGLPTFALNALPLGYYNSIKPPVGEKKAEAPAQNAAASTA